MTALLVLGIPTIIAAADTKETEAVVGVITHPKALSSIDEFKKVINRIGVVNSQHFQGDGSTIELSIGAPREVERVRGMLQNVARIVEGELPKMLRRSPEHVLLRLRTVPVRVGGLWECDEYTVRVSLLDIPPELKRLWQQKLSAVVSRLDN